MIGFLHPGFLYAAAAASAVVIALHFLVAEQPRAGVLPTVRFFPDVDVRSTTLAVRLSDILLLLLRVATLLLIGAAFAQPKVKPEKSVVLRIVAVDVSSANATQSAAADSARLYVAGAADVILFDSIAREMSAKQAMGSLTALRGAAASTARGSLSSALIVALRAASRLRDRADSIELVVVSPVAAEERDSATLPIRRLWPGRIRIVRVPAAASAPPVNATIEWADSSRGSTWIARTKPDSVSGIAFAGQAVIYPFERKWRLGAADKSARVVGRWIDGEPAIVERATASGCVRSVAFSLPARGDAILRPAFTRFVRDLSAPCQSADRTPPSPVVLEQLAGSGGLAPTSRIAPESARMTPLVPWLLAAALLLALIELLLRRVYRIRNDDTGAAFPGDAAVDRKEKVA